MPLLGIRKAICKSEQANYSAHAFSWPLKVALRLFHTNPCSTETTVTKPHRFRDVLDICTADKYSCCIIVNLHVLFYNLFSVSVSWMSPWFLDRNFNIKHITDSCIIRKPIQNWTCFLELKSSSSWDRGGRENFKPWSAVSSLNLLVH